MIRGTSFYIMKHEKFNLFFTKRRSNGTRSFHGFGFLGINETQQCVLEAFGF